MGQLQKCAAGTDLDVVRMRSQYHYRAISRQLDA